MSLWYLLYAQPFPLPVFAKWSALEVLFAYLFYQAGKYEKLIRPDSVWNYFSADPHSAEYKPQATFTPAASTQVQAATFSEKSVQMPVNLGFGLPHSKLSHPCVAMQVFKSVLRFQELN